MLGLQSSVGLPQLSRADVSAEKVFEALDGRELKIDGAACHVEVYGIYDDGVHRWVQLALDGARERMLTLKLGESEAVACALVSLAGKLS